jgi:exonuclease III
LAAPPDGPPLPDATLVSWNVAGRVRRQAEQAERVTALTPDIVCLQEVTARQGIISIAAFGAAALALVLADVFTRDV